jgi:hypothetical protein
LNSQPPEDVLLRAATSGKYAGEFNTRFGSAASGFVEVNVSLGYCPSDDPRKPVVGR